MIHIPDSFFPRNEQGEVLCPRCRKTTQACDCPVIEKQDSAVISADYLVHVRLDKKGRQGKVVTMLTGLPADALLLEDLARRLKSASGSGGTAYVKDGSGTIELQGAHLQKVGQFLLGQGFRVKKYS